MVKDHLLGKQNGWILEWILVNENCILTLYTCPSVNHQITVLFQCFILLVEVWLKIILEYWSDNSEIMKKNTFLSLVSVFHLVLISKKIKSN